MAICSIEDCVSVVYARGWCAKHYQQEAIKGNPLIKKRGSKHNGLCRHCGSAGPFRQRETLCIPCRSKQCMTWSKENLEVSREINNKSAKRYYHELRQTILNHYGCICVCCGETSGAFLVVDHIEGGGNAHRRSIGGNSAFTFYKWIVKNSFPENLQILCHNCNFAKHMGGCPHGKT